MSQPSLFADETELARVRDHLKRLKAAGDALAEALRDLLEEGRADETVLDVVCAWDSARWLP